jgi:alpha-1,2-mannosyltransferase
MTLLLRLERLLIPRRTSYAWIAGGIMWLAWLLSLILGPGNFDLAGHAIGTDYIQFYSAGVTLRDGQSAHLYDFSFQSQMEQAIVGPGLTSFHAFITPPFLAWLFVPLSYLPYTWSFIIWSLFSLLCLWLSFRLIAASQPSRGFLWALTWFPVFAAISFGQNSLLGLLIFSLTYWSWKKDRYLAAGLVSSLLLFKPQLVLGLGLLWLLEWRKSWKSLVGLFIGGTVLVGLCFWLLPDASWSYVQLSRSFLPGMIYQVQFPLIHMHSLRGFFALLLAGNRWLTEGLSMILSILGVVAFYFFWRKYRDHVDILFAATICLTLWITPHAMIYDWCFLIIPAVLFMRALPTMKSLWRSVFALIWIATFISTPLTLAQQKILPVAIQISVPALFFVYLMIYQTLNLNRNKKENYLLA